VKISCKALHYVPHIIIFGARQIFINIKLVMRSCLAPSWWSSWCGTQNAALPQRAIVTWIACVGHSLIIQTTHKTTHSTS